MPHQLSAADCQFRADFEACRLTPAAFDHRAHVRLAYVYLAEHPVSQAVDRLRSSLQTFIRHHGVSPDKYHETLTRAWLLGVRHFMHLGEPARSADGFIANHPRLLDRRIMLSHYSEALLFSPEARASFVEPDLAPIPRHEP